MRSWLIKYRKQCGLSQKALADKVGIAQPSLSSIESGKTNPKPTTAKRIAQVLGFDWTQFFNEKGG